MLYDQTKTSRSEKTAPPALDRSQTLSLAFEYFDRGFHVIPMRGKAPAIPWKNYCDQKATYSEIRRWFGPSAIEDFNIGIVTGRASGTVVVDVDDKESLSYWTGNFPSTPLVTRSGGKRGGKHFYYKTPTDEVVRSRVKVEGRAIDIRAEHAVIVAPPSVHPETGATYQWLTPFDEWSFDDIPVFDPGWIKNSEPPRVPRVWNAADADGNIFRIRKYISHIMAIAGENGHGSAWRATCKLKEAGLSEDQALAELMLWNQTNALPPFSERELAHKIDSAFGGTREKK